MSLPKPDIVIFDMDGTTVRHINPRILNIMEFLDDTAFKLGKLTGWLFKRGASGPIIPEKFRSKRNKEPKLIVHRAIHKFRCKSVEQIVEPCPGIYNVLDLLRKRNIPLALVSNGLGAGYGHDILKTFDLESYFQATIFREDISRSKPDPEPLLKALDSLRFKLSREHVIWYIGDRHKDVSAALAASKGILPRVIPIAYALNAAAAILEKGLSPDHIIMSYHDMYEKLENMFGHTHNS